MSETRIENMDQRQYDRNYAEPQTRIGLRYESRFYCLFVCFVDYFFNIIHFWPNHVKHVIRPKMTKLRHKKAILTIETKALHFYKGCWVG